MIRKLKMLLQETFAEVVIEDSQQSLKLACTVLMFEVLRADYEVHLAELEKIRHHVMRAFSLSEAETQTLMDAAQHKSEHAISLHDVVAAINAEYYPEDKKHLMKMLWDVAYADGKLDKYEEHTIRKLADWLYVPHRDFIQAKHEALT